MSRPIKIYTVSKYYGAVSGQDLTRLEIILNGELHPTLLLRIQEALVWLTYP